jgi:hypothetical protein
MEKTLPIKEENTGTEKSACSSLTTIQISKESLKELNKLKYEISARNLNDVLKYLLFEADKYRGEKKNE